MQTNGNKRVVVVGDACLDIIIPLKQFADNFEGRETSNIIPEISGGGTCANTAVALKKLGIDTAYVGTLGTDYGGKFLYNELNSFGIDTEFTVVDPDLNTANVFAFIDAKGERHMWAFPKENLSFSYLDLSKIDLDKVKRSKWLHSSGMNYLFDGPILEVLPELFKIAFEAGVITSFDLNTRVAKPENLSYNISKAVRDTLPYVRYLLGSAKDEFYSFCPKEDWHDSVDSFVTKDRTVVARIGSEGAYAVSVNEKVMQKPFDVPVVTTVGAGDAFNAGFIASMISGKTLSDGVTWGNAVASYKVMGVSSRHTPTKSQLDNFLLSHKIMI